MAYIPTFLLLKASTYVYTALLLHTPVHAKYSSSSTRILEAFLGRGGRQSSEMDGACI